VPLPHEEGKTYDESNWNTTSSLTVQPYRFSKYLAEKAAWDWAKGKEDSVKLLTICPSFVVGAPVMKITTSVSINTIAGMMNGTTKEVKPSSVPFIHIVDLGQAHIAVVEKESASGRYILSNPDPITQLHIAQILKKEFPDHPIPETQDGGIESKFPQVSNQKAINDLGIKFTPLDASLRGMGRALMDLGLVQKIK